ncbi:MAG: TIGR01777 family protein [Denitrovibrio sp.]|nr:MAG: TIGR01777 family protein [Denitrovibrio sp.]
MKHSYFRCTTEIKSDINTAFGWHEREGALQRLTPPWEKVELLEKDEGIQVGAKCNLNVGTGFFSIPWQAEHIEYYKDKHFKDRQNSGPFSLWEHSNDFEEENGTTTITDSVKYRLPLHPVAKPIAGRFVHNKLKKMFNYRQNVSKNDIEILNEYKPEPKTIVVSGSTGVVGSELIPYLQTQGHKVIRLIRNEKQLCVGDICWNPNSDTIEEMFGHADVVIHLAGEPIGDENWSNEKKLSIVDSRTKSTSLLAKSIAAMENPPKLFISASAIGYYGDRGDEELTEDSPAGTNFISNVCYHCEKATKSAQERGMRVVHLRIGVALSPAGGALERMLTPFKLGIGMVLGSGNQYLSWIGIDDVLYAITHIIETESLDGAINLTAPHPVRMKEFSYNIARILKRPCFFRIPEWLIRLKYGQMGEEVLIAGSNVKPKKILESGFRFRYPMLDDALTHLLGGKK